MLFYFIKETDTRKYMDDLEPSEYEKLTTFAELEPDLSTIKSQSWLNFYYNEDYYNAPVLPSDNNQNGFAIPSNNTLAVAEYKLNAIPNPASEVVDIFYSLPREVEEGQIYIHDLNGKLIQEFQVTKDIPSVKWSINIEQDGIFIYSLIIDGKKYATKKLVVIK